MIRTDAFQAATEMLQSKKLVVTILSQVLDLAIFSFRGIPLEGLSQIIPESLARTIQKFVRVEDSDMPLRT